MPMSPLSMKVSFALAQATEAVVSGNHSLALGLLQNAYDYAKARRSDAIKWRAQRAYIVQAMEALKVSPLTRLN